MARRIFGLALAILLFSSTSFSSGKRAPIGEIIIGGAGEVLVDGVRVAWGSTVFDGSEIQTLGGTAFVRLNEGAGVLSINEYSRVRISRDQGRIVAYVLQGSMTMHGDVASRILTSNQIIESEASNVYSVALAEAGADPLVRTFGKQVSVSSSGKLQAILPEAAESAVQSLLAWAARPHPEGAVAPVVSENQPIFADCGVTVSPCTPGGLLTVTGEVFSFGNALSGALVRAIASFGQGRTAGADRANSSGAFTITIPLNPLQCPSARAGVSVQVLAVSGPRRANTVCRFP